MFRIVAPVSEAKQGREITLERGIKMYGMD